MNCAQIRNYKTLVSKELRSREGTGPKINVLYSKNKKTGSKNIITNIWRLIAQCGLNLLEKLRSEGKMLRIHRFILVAKQRLRAL